MLIREMITLIGELLDCLPDNCKWKDEEPQDWSWHWCWKELSDEAQGKIALVRRKAVALLLAIERAQEGK